MTCQTHTRLPARKFWAAFVIIMDHYEYLTAPSLCFQSMTYDTGNIIQRFSKFQNLTPSLYRCIFRVCILVTGIYTASWVPNFLSVNGINIHKQSTKVSDVKAQNIMIIFPVVCLHHSPPKQLHYQLEVNKSTDYTCPISTIYWSWTLKLANSIETETNGWR